jgi:ParB-like chromosome segregation protein Spo0J
MNIKNKKTKDLVPATYNPRQLSKIEYEQIKESLESFGFVNPIVVNTHKGRENVVVGGHQRIKVWEAMGNTEVPVVEVNLTEAKEKELNIRLNKASGSWDWDILANEFDIDQLLDWGFLEKELDFGSDFTGAGGDVDLELELPSELEQAGVKMVQIFLNQETHPVFMAHVQKDKEEHESITDVIYRKVVGERD